MPKNYLIVQRGKDIGSRINLTEARTTIGRNTDNVLVISDDGLISRYHAVIVQNGNSVSLIDLGSTNGVAVNNEMVEPGVPQNLNNRDIIHIGHSIFSLQLRDEGYKVLGPPNREDADATRPLELPKLYS